MFGVLGSAPDPQQRLDRQAEQGRADDGADADETPLDQLVDTPPGGGL